MVDGYCEVEDVRLALQEATLSGPTDAAYIKPAIASASDWLAKASQRHWYDSNAAPGDIIDTSAESAGPIRLDVPASPHAQHSQIYRHERGMRYPVTTDGTYARVALPHGYVESLSALDVRDRAGDVEDWVASSEFQQGRGEDYYVLDEQTHAHGRSYLYVNAGAIGPRHDYGGLLTAEYSHGLDATQTGWKDVRRGVANLAAAQVVVDDDVLTRIPDNGQLVGLDTQYDKHVDAALTQAWSTLKPYL